MRFYHFVEQHFTFVLLAACVVGLAVPGMASIPDWTAGFVLGLLTFFSCFKLRDGGFSEIRWRRIALFYLLRYVLLPVVFLWLARALTPDYAMAIFLLALVPTAVSSPAFVSVFGGHVASAFALVLVSTLLAPLLIPLQFAWAESSAVAPAPIFLFKTLVLCVFVPIVFYVFARRYQALSDTIYKRNKFLAIVLVFFIIALVVAKQRDLILADIPAIIPMLLINVACFICFLLAGWFFMPRKRHAQRITFATCSMFNNVALGVSLALLHFPPDVILFVAASEMAWAMLPAIMNLWIRKFG
jgi:predicted Na+-dependent transporter